MIWIILPAVLAAIVIACLGLLFYQGRRLPTNKPEYVALGSSFAAGLGLGGRAPGSPVVCMRSLNGYPQQLAQMRNLSLADMTCSGATLAHILHGGRFFLRSQLDALSLETKLVTLTAGGNDVRYVGDLTFMAARMSPSLPGRVLRRFWRGPLAVEQRNYIQLQANLATVLHEIRRRSPHARIILVSYPAILPPEGSCRKLNITPEEATVMRAVGERLATLTCAAAAGGQAVLVDMHSLGTAHHACSETPWVNGWLDVVGAKYHPTIEGSQATARAISEALDRAGE